MRAHVAILMQPYLDMVLQGRKTIESRMTQRPLAPFQQIEPGDRIYFKKSAGPFMGAGIAADVAFYDNVTPATMAQLKRTHNEAIGGDDAYWQRKSRANFVSLITLTHVVPVSFGPKLPPSNGLAWFVLDDKAAATAPRLAGITLTEGALRNGYLRIGATDATALGLKRTIDDDRADLITLDLPSGQTVETDLTERGMLRWRGWRAVFREQHARAGDRVTLVERRPSPGPRSPGTPGRFAVVFHPSAR